MHTIEALNHIEGEKERKKKEHLRMSPIKEDIGLSKQQADFIKGAIDIKQKTAKEIMIPMHQITMIDYNEKLTEDKLKTLLKKGFSRIPVYSKTRDNIIGILRMKHLIGLNIPQNQSLQDLNVSLSHPIVFSPNERTINLLNEFKKGKSHMAFITENVESVQQKMGLNRTNSFINENLFINPFNHRSTSRQSGSGATNVIGIVTLEDVFEKTFNVEILDEDDYSTKKANEKNNKYGKDVTEKICTSFIANNKERINSMVGNSLLNNNINEEVDLAEGNYKLLDNKLME